MAELKGRVSTIRGVSVFSVGQEFGKLLKARTEEINSGIKISLIIPRGDDPPKTDRSHDWGSAQRLRTIRGCKHALVDLTDHVH